MVKFTSQVALAAVLSGLTYGGVDAFAGLKQKVGGSALQMVSSVGNRPW